MATTTEIWVYGNPLVPEHSLNPCLVMGAHSADLRDEPAAQDDERRILLRISGADVGQCGEVDRGARESERTLSRPRDIATLSRQRGDNARDVAAARFGALYGRLIR